MQTKWAKTVILLCLVLVVSLAACSRPSKPEDEGEQEAEKVLTTDVVVVGAGGTGLAAAASAHDNGAEVIVLEKLERINHDKGQFPFIKRLQPVEGFILQSPYDCVSLIFFKTQDGLCQINNLALRDLYLSKINCFNNHSLIPWKTIF